MTSIKFLYNFLIIAVAAGLTCNTTDPHLALELKLELEDVSCTEAWITLTINNVQLPAEVVLYKNNTAQNNILCYGDTLLYIDSLLPSQTYKFHTTIQSSIHTSNEISVTTMDTTSHNFTFETWTFGGTGSSTLYDVAIIDENNIWAVGEIYVADTSANGYTIYNAVHWDGNEWSLHRIMFYSICGQQSSQNAYPASSIIAFSEDEIWVAQRGDQITKIENGIQKQAICMPWTFSINKIWGTSSNDLYVVGNNGNIARYQNGQWTRIESGTDLHIYDIWGEQTENGEYEILCVASNVSINQGKKVLQITKTNIIHINDMGLPWSLSTVWFIPERKYFIGGDGFYTAKYLGDSWIRD
jgi:hypothetical protein